jgi:hypothetical protein
MLTNELWVDVMARVTAGRVGYKAGGWKRRTVGRVVGQPIFY